jgi:uncharacterized Zn finger protein (UPF0148 family)
MRGTAMIITDCPDCGTNVEVSTHIGDLNVCPQCDAQFWFDIREGIVR